MGGPDVIEARFGQASNGTVRAQDWSRLPIIRMTNINLMPGDWAEADAAMKTISGTCGSCHTAHRGEKTRDGRYSIKK